MWKAQNHTILDDSGRVRLVVIPRNDEDMQKAETIASKAAAAMNAEDAISRMVVHYENGNTVEVYTCGKHREEALDTAQRLDYALKQFKGMPTNAIKNMPVNVIDMAKEILRLGAIVGELDPVKYAIAAAKLQGGEQPCGLCGGRHEK